MTANSKHRTPQNVEPTAQAANDNTPEEVAIVNGLSLPTDDVPVPEIVPEAAILSAGHYVRRPKEWADKGISEAAIEAAIEAEHEMARRGYDKFVAWCEGQLTRGSVVSTPGGKELARRLLGPVCDHIIKFQEGEQGLLDPLVVKAKKLGGRQPGAAYKHMIDKADPLSIAVMTLTQIIKTGAVQGSIQHAITGLGEEIERYMHFDTLFRANKALAEQNARQAAARNDPVWQAKARINISLEHLGVEWEPWPSREKQSMAATLIRLVIERTGIAITQTRRLSKTKSVTEIVLNAEHLGLIEDLNENAALLQSELRPFLAPPRDWASPRDGIFWSDNVKGINILGRDFSRDRMDTLYAAHGERQLDPVYAALNAVQSTPFRVNRRVFDVMTFMWDAGTCVGGDMVQQEPERIPDKPAQDAGEEVWSGWKQQAASAHTRNRTSLSKRIAFNTMITQARELRTKDAFWYGWHCDFRGRMYPVQNGLTPQGMELEKALLEFAKAVPIDGPSAQLWLGIHGANCWGGDSDEGKTDKLPLVRRLAWAQANTKKIVACAESPLTTTWWRQAGDPWLFLAFCFDWSGHTKAQAAGKVHWSHLPVSIDGTCNGLQHLSALCRDAEGAAAVNLIPSEHPRDIYGDCAERTIEMLKQSVQTNSEFARGAGDMLEFGITRKETKRTVMTIPYGLSQHSANDYIREAFEERAISTGKQAPWRTKDGDLDRDRLRETRTHAEITIWHAVVGTIGPAMAVMAWVQECSRRISAAGQDMGWTSPSGWPVLQRYRKTVDTRLDIKWCAGRETAVFQIETKELSPVGHKNGSAPNVVHSIDAAHMVATINESYREGVTDFMMIHDSFATHAGSLATLHAATRNTFADIYANDALAGLALQWAERYGIEVPELPQYGTLDTEVVRESQLFFS